MQGAIQVLSFTFTFTSTVSVPWCVSWCLTEGCRTDQCRYIFFNKLQHTDNPILRTLFHLPTVKYEILGPAAKYGLNGVQGNLYKVKDCVWTCFVQKVRF